MCRGTVWETETDSAAVYRKTILSGVVPPANSATVSVLGGHSAVTGGEIVSARVTEIISENGEGETLGSVRIPEAIRELEGYGMSAGSAYNELNLAAKKYIRRLGAYTFTGTETWRNWGEAWITTVSIPAPACDSTTATPNNIFKNCSAVPAATIHNTGVGRGMAVVNENGTVNIYIGKYEFNRKMILIDGFTVWYELDEPVETDISGLTGDILVPVESGGSVTFAQENGTEYTIPNTISYIRKIEPAAGKKKKANKA